MVDNCEDKTASVPEKRSLDESKYMLTAIQASMAAVLLENKQPKKH